MAGQTRPDKTTYVRFFASVDGASVKTLLTSVDEELKQGMERLVLMVSSPGGNVHAGLSAYNYLRGIPAQVIAHNFGSADSVAIVLYCAGSRRLCVPQARFLLHGVVANFPQGGALEEKQLEERLKSLRIDTENIAGVIAANCRKSEAEVHQAMLERTVLNPEEAIEWGLVHEIQESLFPAGARVITVQ